MIVSYNAESILSRQSDAIKAVVAACHEDLQNTYKEKEAAFVRALIIYQLVNLTEPKAGEIIMDLFEDSRELYKNSFEPALEKAQQIADELGINITREKIVIEKKLPEAAIEEILPEILSKEEVITESPEISKEEKDVTEMRPRFQSVSKPPQKTYVPSKVEELTTRTALEVKKYYENILASAELQPIHDAARKIWQAYPPTSSKDIRKSFIYLTLLAEKDQESVLKIIREELNAPSLDPRRIVAEINRAPELLTGHEERLKEKGFYSLAGNFFFPLNYYLRKDASRDLWESVPAESMPVADRIVGYSTTKKKMPDGSSISYTLSRALLLALHPESPKQVLDVQHEIKEARKTDKNITIASARAALEMLHKELDMPYTERACFVEKERPPLSIGLASKLNGAAAPKEQMPLPADQAEDQVLASRRNLEELVKQGKIERQDALIYFRVYCSTDREDPKTLARQFGRSAASIEAGLQKVSKVLYGSGDADDESDKNIHPLRSVRP